VTAPKANAAPRPSQPGRAGSGRRRGGRTTRGAQRSAR
jgi:hypothetical protein